MLFASILSIGRILLSFFVLLLFLLSLPKLTSFRFSYAILLYNIILKVYFFILDSTGNNSFSIHKFHLMINKAKILVHPYEK